MLRVRLIAVAALAMMLSGCMSDGNGLETSTGVGGLGGLNLGGGLGASSLPGTDAYVKQQLERRGI